MKSEKKMLLSRSIPQTADEDMSSGSIPQTADEDMSSGSIPQTADEDMSSGSIPQMADEDISSGSILHTADETLSSRSVPQTTDEDSAVTITISAQTHKIVKSGRDCRKMDKGQGGQMLRDLIPCLTALLLLCVIAFCATGAFRRSVEAYCQRIFQENEEYFSYE